MAEAEVRAAAGDGGWLDDFAELIALNKFEKRGAEDAPESPPPAQALPIDFSAPAFAIDPTYQQAVREKIERSIREGYLTADLKAADPAQRGR